MQTAEFCMILNDFILIAVVTLFFSFGVQLGFYLYYFYIGDSLIKEQKSVVDYLSGIIGDAVLMPAVNIFALATLKEDGITSIEPIKLFWAVMISLTITSLFHIGQILIKEVNWTMPIKSHWNLLGVYHALFMFSEITLLAFTLIIYLNSNQPNVAIWYALTVLLLFLITFIYDYLS